MLSQQAKNEEKGRGKGRGAENMTCKKICERYKAPGKCTGRKYGNGNKRCSRCEIMIVWEGVHCPCCGFHLRVGPRANKYREMREKPRIG
jgi:hypothetical protein